VFIKDDDDDDDDDDERGSMTMTMCQKLGLHSNLCSLWSNVYQILRM